jgi:tripartite-type tricarboxylate transporter receptor subunit TctC
VAPGCGGCGAPRGTPAAIVDLLNRELNAAIANPGVRARITDLGGTPVGGTAAEFEAVLAAAIEKWGRVIKFAGIKAD